MPFDELIAEWSGQPLPRPTPRTVRMPSVPGKVDAIVGMRRSGKTWFCYQKIHELVEAGLPRSRSLYVNLEDERLLPLEASDLGGIPEAFYRRFPESREQECWFLFDEIQNVPGWERFIRRLLDTERVRLVVTGSSAKLDSREIGTSLRGRCLTTEILPFSFVEALAHAGIEVGDSWPPSKVRTSRIAHAFDRYIETGGFPEVQGLEEGLRLRVLQEYASTVLYRDVVERHGVTNLVALRYMLRHLLRNPAGRFSVNRFSKDLRSQGVRVGKDTIHAYLQHLSDAFIVFPVYRESRSERQRMVNPRKCYLVDPALPASMRFGGPENSGATLENLVYLELRRRELEVTYLETASGYEIDFLARDTKGRESIVQVSMSLADPETRARELRACSEAMAERGLEEVTWITNAESESVVLPQGTVRVVPAWSWLCEPHATSPGA